MTEAKEIDVLYTKEDLSKMDFTGRLRAQLVKRNYSIAEGDLSRPWGGFFRISDKQSASFIAQFFPGVNLPRSTEGATLSPKFLIVEAGKKLSWQVHARRAEFWRVLRGPVAVYRSKTDEQPDEPKIFNNGETIDLPVGTRHRLAGLDGRGVVAEIWIHTNPKKPSDETDIRRIADDFGRQRK